MRLRAADVAGAGARLTVIGEVGGRPRRSPARVGPGEAVRIFTGAPMPDGADAVVDAGGRRSATGDDVGVRGHRASRRQSARTPASISARASRCCRRGRRLTPRDVALAAAANHATLPVRRRPRVAILATGDELVAPGEPLGPGADRRLQQFRRRRRSSRRAAAWRSISASPRDDLERARRRRSARRCDAKADVLVTLGGASVGDYDLVQKALVAAGMELGFWKIAMRPGKPLMHGRLGAMRVLGPARQSDLVRRSARSCSCVRCSARCSGEPARRRRRERTRAARPPMPANGPRQDYCAATLVRTEEGHWAATPAADQDSRSSRRSRAPTRSLSAPRTRRAPKPARPAASSASRRSAPDPSFCSRGRRPLSAVRSRSDPFRRRSRSFRLRNSRAFEIIDFSVAGRRAFPCFQGLAWEGGPLLRSLAFAHISLRHPRTSS